MTRSRQGEVGKERHVVDFVCEGRGHRARCSSGWWSDCYAQASDTARAVTVHRRREESRHE